MSVDKLTTADSSSDESLASPPAITIGTLLDFLAPAGAWQEKVLSWPPDAFALAYALLTRSGVYTALVSRQWSLSVEPVRKNRDAWTDEARLAASEWWRYATLKRADRENQGPPPVVVGWWSTILAARDLPLPSLNGYASENVAKAILRILAAADETCALIGNSSISPFREGDPDMKDLDFLREAMFRLNEYSDLCLYLRRGSIVTLPKMHTPQAGLTMRSLSLHICAVQGGSIEAQWRRSGAFWSLDEAPQPLEGAEGAHSLNVLIVPWPQRIRPSSFKPVNAYLPAMNDAEFGFFAYEPTDAPSDEALQKLVATAQTDVGEIDLLVFPELSLPECEVQRLTKVLWKICPSAVFVAGVGGASKDSGLPGENKAIFRAPGMFLDPDPFQAEQKKHHRWRIERRQIEQYGLGSTLDPEKQWWEHTDISSRKLVFLPVRDNVVMSVLICEDLAQQDPMAELVRAVGPNLVIALLMDGPQLSSRWASRYATVLADDPGCSVLTLTSIGMVELSKPPGKIASRVVALWKDCRHGEREIELPKEASGVVLSLTRRYMTEFAADGRTKDKAALHLDLSGVYPIDVGRA